MAASIPRQERLMALIAELLHTERPLTAEELWERVPGYDPTANIAALRRAFERDKNSLRAQGIPIEVSDAPGYDPPREGYRIDRSRYYLTMPALETDELAALRLAAVVVRVGDEHGGDGSATDRALWRLGGVVTDDDGAVLASLGAAAAARGPMATVHLLPGLEALFAAIAANVPVEIHYNDTTRVVHPYRLDVKWGRWYLAAHDTSHDEVRRFRVDRLQPLPTDDAGEATHDDDADVVRLLDGTFPRPTERPGPPPDVWAFGEGSSVTAQVLVDAAHVTRLRHEVEDGATVELRDDGAAVFTFEVRNVEGFRWLVLGLLEHGEVLSPPALRADVVEWLEQLEQSA